MTSRHQVRHCCEACGQPVDNWTEPLARDGVMVTDSAVAFGDKSKKLLKGSVELLRLLMLRGRLSHEAFAMVKETESLHDQSSVYCCLLRKALRRIGAPLEIVTVYGWGYELRTTGATVAAP